MQTLWKLSFTKLKSRIRLVFSKPLPAILTVLAVLFYGGTAVMTLIIPKDATELIFEQNNIGVNTMILVIVGITALMTFSMLITKNKALLYKEDAYYLFTMPFSFKQLIQYVMLNNIFQGVLMSAIIFYIMIVFSMGMFGLGFLFLSFFFVCLIQILLLTLIDYFYLLEIINPKTQYYKWLFIGVILAFTGAIVGRFFITNGFNVEQSLLQFALAPEFHFVPIYGWLKYTLVALYENNMLLVGIMTLVFGGLIYGSYLLLSNIKGDFFAEALEDAQKMSEYLKAKNKGKLYERTTKVRQNIVGKFHQGEWAIFDKNILMLKKNSTSFFKSQEFLVMIIYLVMAYFINLNVEDSMISGYSTYTGMMSVVVVMGVMQSSITDELKSYYVYLIPGNPFKKMLAVLFSGLIKPLLTIVIAFVIGGLVFQTNPLTVLTTILQYTGVMLVMMAGNILSVRILKNQNNIFVENMLRMLIMLIAFIPTAIIIIIIGVTFGWDVVFNVAPVVLFIVNTIAAFVIITICAPMLKGTEITISEEQ